MCKTFSLLSETNGKELVRSVGEEKTQGQQYVTYRILKRTFIAAKKFSFKSFKTMESEGKMRTT